jgi:transposase
MDFWTRMKDTLDKGIASSRDLYDKARDKAQDLTDRGILRFEIGQLENQAEKLIAKLGSRTFEVLVREGQSTVSRKTSGVRELIEEVEAIQGRIKEKEDELEKVHESDKSTSESGQKP